MNIQTKRIKEIRKKIGQDNYSAIPIGADGYLIDMLSNLDLEEELKLGNNHYVQVEEIVTEEDVETTKIKEWYFTEAKGNNTIQDMANANKITYSCSIVISMGKQQTIEEQTKFYDQITMNLYQGDIEDNHLLHSKTVRIDQPSTTKAIINEEVDKQ